MDRGAWWASVHGVPKNPTGLSNFHFRRVYAFVKTHEMLPVDLYVSL